jgi:hypothetical protein
MTRAYPTCLFLCLAAIFLLSPATPAPVIDQAARVVPPLNAPQADPKDQARILDRYGKLPLSFEANHGQSDGRVKFLSRNGGYTLFLTEDEAVLALRGRSAHKTGEKTASIDHASQSPAARTTDSVLRMKLSHANPAAKVTGVDELAGTSNYFIGNDPAKWRSNIPTYAQVKYEGIYSGIDLVYYGNQRQLEYDFVVAPGADPRRIAFDVRGAKRVRKDEHGDLVLKMSEGEIRWRKPLAYQEEDGARQEVAACYSITGTNRVGFEVAGYDASRTLYIDPLIYSTYLGGSGDDFGNGIAVDSAGNAYVTGSTTSTNFPTMNPLQPNNGGSMTAFVTKINAAGSALVYSTYLGGSGGDTGYGIAIDGAGNAYVTGSTSSTNFPTKNPLQSANGGGGDAFVTKINASGSALVYSTYLGGSGSDVAYGLALDSAGNAYVTGKTASTNFPTQNPFQPVNHGGNPAYDAFVAKINSSGSALVYSTYLGGSNYDVSSGIAVDSAGNAYVVGTTYSTDFPTLNALGPAYFGSGDAFVTKFDPSGSALVYSTYLGTSADYFDYRNGNGNAIAVDTAGDAYVTGTYYTTYCNFNTCNYFAIADQINSTGSAFVYQTNPIVNASGSSYSIGYAIAVDNSGRAFVTGVAGSDTPNPLYRTFVAKLDSTGAGVGSPTFLSTANSQTYGYGIATDGLDNAYVTGATSGTGFPTKNPLQPANAGGYDAFVTKIDMGLATTTTLSSSLNPSAYGQAVTFTANVTSSSGAPPNGETVTFMKGTTVLGTGTLSGGSASFTTATLLVSRYAIQAVYGGDLNLAGGTSKSITQVVTKATTTSTLTSSQNPSSLGQSVTFTASVAPQFSGAVTGQVAFYDGTTILKNVSLSGGVANFTTAKLTSGTHTITATYEGNGNFSTSSAALTQTVN